MVLLDQGLSDLVGPQLHGVWGFLGLVLQEFLLGHLQLGPLLCNGDLLIVLLADNCLTPRLKISSVLIIGFLCLSISSVFLFLRELVVHFQSLREALAGQLRSEDLQGVARSLWHIFRNWNCWGGGLRLPLALALRLCLDRPAVLVPILTRLELPHRLFESLRLRLAFLLDLLLLLLGQRPEPLQELRVQIGRAQVGEVALHRRRVRLHPPHFGVRGLFGHLPEILKLRKVHALTSLCEVALFHVDLALIAFHEYSHACLVLFLQLLGLVIVLLPLRPLELAPGLCDLGQLHRALLLGDEQAVRLLRLHRHVHWLLGQGDEPHAVLQLLNDLALVGQKTLDGNLDALRLRKVLLPHRLLHVFLDLGLPLLKLLHPRGVVLFLRGLVKLHELHLVCPDLLGPLLLAFRRAVRVLLRLPLVAHEHSEARLRGGRRRVPQELEGHDFHGLVHELRLDFLLVALVLLELLGLLERRQLALELLLGLGLLLGELGLLIRRGLYEFRLQGAATLALALASRHLGFVCLREHREHRLGPLRQIDQADGLVLPFLGFAALQEEVKIRLPGLELILLLVEFLLHVLYLRGVFGLLFSGNLGPFLCADLGHFGHGLALQLLGKLRRVLFPPQRHRCRGLLGRPVQLCPDEFFLFLLALEGRLVRAEFLELVGFPVFGVLHEILLPLLGRYGVVLSLLGLASRGPQLCNLLADV
mmetsp:Transcript_3483/g.9806  ORF Transcript_3483/g.9806 Transcript_3483/m.9806 type:complete len:703 (+) Transcript_3483:1297-3405(+)